MDPSVYDADYYLHGRNSGKSLYDNYRWLPDLTVPMAERIAAHLGIQRDQVILDFGCARGFTVRAFRELGFECYGVDVSQWAIDHCDETVKSYVACTPNIPPGMDWIVAKDVLEHVPDAQEAITRMMESARVGVFAVVPLSEMDGAKYTIPDYELDVTHIHRLTLASWVRMFVKDGWRIECSYRVRGVKENYHGWLTWINNNYDLWRHGNGFITARRM